MTSFDALRGDGSFKVQRALAGLQGNHMRLDRERQRFNRSPPLYTSIPSGTTTRTTSPDPSSEEQKLHQQRRVQLGLQAQAYKPRKQFSAQIKEGEQRVFEASLSGIHRIPVESDPRTIARVPSRSSGSSKASGTTNGIISLLGDGSTKKRSSLSLNRTQT